MILFIFVVFCGLRSMSSVLIYFWYSYYFFTWPGIVQNHFQTVMNVYHNSYLWSTECWGLHQNVYNDSFYFWEVLLFELLAIRRLLHWGYNRMLNTSMETSNSFQLWYRFTLFEYLLLEYLIFWHCFHIMYFFCIPD